MVRRKGRKRPSHPCPIPEATHWLLAQVRNSMIEVSIHEATHVRVGTRVEKITSKWGIDPRGRLAKLSQGGFGVITESGRRVPSWLAGSYLKQGASWLAVGVIAIPGNHDLEWRRTRT
jgi:hypothetical protein